jgi:hypothetical protein
MSVLTHTVFFTLNHPDNIEERETFFEAAKNLASLPGVKNFKCVKQISQKNNFDYGLTMDFQNEKDYQGYCDHPEHVEFVEQVWKRYVRDFMEIDFHDL